MENINNKECNICHGEGCVQKDISRLYDICPKCGGLGYIDWISKSMGRNTTYHNRRYDYGIAHRNIDILRRLIMEEARRVGQDVIVEIRSISARQMHMHRNFDKNRKPAINWGRLLNVPNIKRI